MAKKQGSAAPDTHKLQIMIEHLTDQNKLILEAVAGTEERIMRRLDERIAPIERRLDVIEAVLADHSRILADHSRILADHSRILADHSRRLDEVSQALLELRQDVRGIERQGASRDEAILAIARRVSVLESEVAEIQRPS